MENTAARTLEVLKEIYNVDQLLSGKDYIKELVQRLARSLQVNFAMVGHAIEPHRVSVQSDFLWARDKFVDNIVYNLEGTPCVDTICGTRVNCYASDVQRSFPRDQMLMDMNIHSYIGAPFLHTDGGLIGLLVIMDDKPIENVEIYTSVVEFFAARIGTEYRRLAAEDILRRINESLEKQVQERTNQLQQAFEELKETQRQLISQEKLATIGRITFGIAHELRNPLNVIINSAEILREDDLDKETEKKVAAMIHQHGVRANTIISNMLRQARQEVSAEPEWVNMSEILDHCLDVYVRSLTDIDFKTHLVLKKNIEPKVFARIIDPPSIERVLINIIDNSLYALRDKFHKDKGNFVPTLEVNLKSARESFSIVVRDNGPGISFKHLPNIWDEFYTTKPPGEGTGLGLWIAKQNIEKNRGQIQIESEEGNFTQVRIELPGTRLLEAQL